MQWQDSVLSNLHKWGWQSLHKSGKAACKTQNYHHRQTPWASKEDKHTEKEVGTLAKLLV